MPLVGGKPFDVADTSRQTPWARQPMVDDANRDSDGLIGLIRCDVDADVTPES